MRERRKELNTDDTARPCTIKQRPEGTFSVRLDDTAVDEKGEANLISIRGLGLWSRTV